MAKASNWNIAGINLCQSDAIFQDLQKAIAADKFTSLIGIAGHRGPMDIDYSTRTVTFRNF